jgi:hypothetical protein
MDVVVRILPGLILASICMVMMLLMMRGGHGGHNSRQDEPAHGQHPGSEELVRLREEVAELRRQVGAPAPSANGHARTEAERR